MTLSLIALSLGLFALAGLFAIGGGYLVWRWWRNGDSWVAGVAGAALLALYGIVPTYSNQPTSGVSTQPTEACSS
jgi:small multidrug resistance family-3 protein